MAPLAMVLTVVSALAGCVIEEPGGGESASGSGMSGDPTAPQTAGATLSGTGSVEPTGGGFDGSATEGGTTLGDTEGEATDDGPGDDNGGGFIYGSPDGGDDVGECDIFAQDCPPGEKCMPWANDGGSAWNDVRCSPVEDNPGQPGDVCTVEGSGVSGLDDCDVGVMCWDVDTETNVGTCTAMCTGTEANPLCEDPDTTCIVSNDGVLALCLPICDPLLQDCAEGTACYPFDDQFVCAPDASTEGSGGFGDECEFINVCQPGLACVAAAGVPGCMASGCCTEFCDLTDPASDAQCTGAPEGQQCLPFFEEGVFPGTNDIGLCLLP